MATNLLGSAYVRIVPQVNFGGLSTEIRRAIEPALTQVNRLNAGLDQTGQAGRRAAANLDGIGDAARRASGDVDQLRDDMDQAGRAGADAAEQTESGWQGAFGRITGGVKGAFLGAGAAAAAAFGVGLAGAIEQQDGTNRLQASLGLSDADAARLGKVAGGLYADAYGESLGAVQEAVGVVVRDIEGMGTASNQALEGFTGKALSVADIMEHDVADVTRAVATIMANDLAPSADAALDVIARGTQLGGNRADDLLDTFGEYSPLFAQLGLSADQSMGLLVQGLKGGARDTDFLADAIKEMTLLVQAMPEATGTAFSDLGLDAAKFQADIGAGGQRASTAFNALLGALRAVKDPIKQNEIAVGLFGTKAEDLQDALFTMDPSTAVAALGQVGGAATQLDKDLNSGVKTALTQVKRTIETGLWEAAGVALPPLTSLATTVASKVGPAFDLGKVGVKGFFSALSGEGATSDGFVGGMERAGVVVRDLGGVASKAWQLILPGLRDLGGVVTESVWPSLRNLWEIAKGLWPDIQAIGQIVGAVLLVAFRALAAVLANVIGPALREITGFWRSNQTLITALAVAIGVGVAAWYLYRAAVVAVETAQWIWQTRTLLMQAVMRSVQGGMAALRTATLLLNSAFLANPIGIIIVALIALAAGFAYAYTHSETFRNIVQGALTWVGNTAVAVGRWFVGFGSDVLGVLSAVGSGAQAFGGFFVGIFRGCFDFVSSIVRGGLAIWRGVIDIGLGGILLAAQLWWTAFSTPFRVGFEVIRGLFSFFSALFRGDWEGAWNAISSTTTRILGIVRGAIDSGLGAIKTAFQTTRDGIGVIWDGLKAVASAPVKFVVETVYNNGIRKAWNAIVAKIPGVPEMGALNVPGLKAGGPITGGVRGRDSVLRWLMPGEHVLTAGEVANAGGHGRIFALRAALGGGTQATGPGMALGGVGSALGAAWDATGGRVADKLEDLARQGLAKGFELAIGPLRSLMNSTLGRGDNWKGVTNRLIQSPFDKLIEWVKGKEAAMVPDVGPVGAGVARWSGVASSALTAAGQPLSWLPLLLKRMNQESGGNPNAINRWDINAKNGVPSQGLMQVIPPTFAAYAGAYRGRGILDPFANIYAAVQYSMSRYGNLGKAWNRAGGYDQGGPLHPGWTMAYNGTGHDEWVSVHKPGGGGAVLTLNQTVDARGASDPAEFEQIVQRANADLLAGLDQMLQQGEGTI